MLCSKEAMNIWCHKVLPLVYDDALSYYEVVCKLVEKMSEFSSDITEIMAEIEALKSSLPTVILEEINKLIADGTLEKLINDTLLNSKMDANAPFAGSNMLAKVWSDQNKTVAVQSLCFVDDILWGYRVDSADNGELFNFDQNFDVNETFAVNAGHGNGLCYSPVTKRFYLANDTITIVDYETKGLAGTVTGISGVYTCCFYEGKLYAISNGVLYTIDENDYALTPIYRIPSSTTGNNIGGSCIVDGRLYVNYHVPEMISCYDGGKLVKVWNFGDTYADYTDRIVELEGLAYNGKFYVGAYGGANANAIYEFSPFTNVPTKNAFQLPQFNRALTLYVNSESTAKGETGAQDAPFKTFAKAFDYINSPYFNGYSITLNCSGTFQTLQCVGLKSIVLITGNITVADAVFQQSNFVWAGGTITGNLSVSRCNFVVSGYTATGATATFSNCTGTLDPNNGADFTSINAYFAFLNTGNYFNANVTRNAAARLTGTTLAFNSATPVTTGSVGGLTSRMGLLFVLKTPGGNAPIYINVKAPTSYHSLSYYTGSAMVTLMITITFNYQGFNVTGNYYDGALKTGLPTGVGITQIYNLD